MTISDDPGLHQQLAAAFTEAALTPSAWIGALELLADCCGAERGQLIGLTNASHVEFNWITAPHGEELGELARDFHTPDVNYRVAIGANAREGEVVGDDDYDRVIAGMRDLRYVRLCQEAGIPHGFQTNLRADAATLVGLATLGPIRPVDQHRRRFAEAVPLARTAVRIQASLEHQGAKLVAGTLEAMSVAAIVLDRSGAVAAVTPAADALLSRGGLFRVVDQRLVATRPENDRAFERALRQSSLLGRARSRAQSLAFLPSSETESTRVVDILTLPATAWSMQYQPRTVVVIRGEGERPMETTLLQQVLGLTPAEAEIAWELARGQTRSDIARARGVSEGTVHAQLRSIFSKADVRREAALIAQVRDILSRV